MNRTVATVAALVAGSAVVVSVTKHINNLTEQHQLAAEMSLDIQAMKRASDRVEERRLGGVYDYPSQIMEDWNSLYDFERIAIREE